jgi:hypothetical protein
MFVQQNLKLSAAPRLRLAVGRALLLQADGGDRVALAGIELVRLWY